MGEVRPADVEELDNSNPASSTDGVRGARAGDRVLADYTH